MYDFIIVTHIPVFYKVNLYNEIAKEMKILVIFIASNTNEKRSEDFVTLENAHFEYELLYEGNIQERNIRKNIFHLFLKLKKKKYKKIIVGGWDLMEYWYLAFTNPRLKNCSILESTINESKVDLIRANVKRLFLSRISTVFASGNLHEKLLKKLNYKGEIKITKGVGIINKPKINIIKRKYEKKYLFIGRLSKEKNIEMLVDIFNDLPDHTLTIIGTGPLEGYLKTKAKQNIKFIGQIVNQNLSKFFEQNNILILTSIAEPWGLVIEEALYFGIPAIVSSNCGACVLIEEGINGYVVDYDKSNYIKDTILNINNDIYEELICGVGKFSVDDKDSKQARVYFAS
tara:strand:+ start:3935 stop:4966 length:1032 start_codon:yes stop_codon:yes gene_type:complete